jgi:pimeloyl-ACP methyl ester carboxylesterase
MLCGQLLIPTRWASAGEIRLKNDLTIEGRSIQMQSLSAALNPTGGEVTTYPITMVNAGMQRYYVPSRNIIEANNDAELSKYTKFKIPQRRRSRSKMLGSVGLFSNVTGINKFGRRSVTINTARGPLVIDQGVTEIGPKYIKITAIDYAWQFAIATQSIPIDAVDKMIREVTDQDKPEDRFAIVSFYVEAKLYIRALIELENIAKDLPELKDKTAERILGVRQRLAQTLIDELSRRKAHGQHNLAYAQAKQFPTDKMSASILRQVREFLAEYDKSRDDGETIVASLGELQAALPNAGQRESLEPMRLEVTEQLQFDALPRLRPFLDALDNDAKSAEEKLALAYSGWILGDADATDRLDVTINLWQARFQVLNYLRCTNEKERSQMLADITRIENIGPDAIYKMIAHLPAQLETPGIRAGSPHDVVIDNAVADAPNGTPEMRYRVMLPTEYSAHRSYPLIVAMHSVKSSPEWELRWWAGTERKPLQAQRNGYIVIVPEYVDEGDKTYDYSPISHYRVIQSIRDARKRFNIDSDRIFLAGHGTGGDAAFDLGMAHPDIFAGVIPICGVIDGICIRIFRNGRRIPWYCIGGQLDRNLFERNAKTFNSMMISGYDLVLAEYVGRGYESYYSEIHRIFEWMELHRRSIYPKDFTIQVMRPNNNRHYWLKAHTLETPPARNRNGSTLSTRAKSTHAEIQTGSDRWNTITIRSAARKYTIWLSPDMLDFEKRLRVRVKGTFKFNGFVESEIETILEDVRIRGDRQKIYEARIEIDPLKDARSRR